LNNTINFKSARKTVTLDKVSHNDIITFIKKNVDETSNISKDSERDTIAESILLDDV